MEIKQLISAFAGLAMIGAGIYLWKKNKTQQNTTTSMETKETLIEGGTLPRGYRNNNPLNIRYNSSNNWLGKVTPNTDGTFEQFRSMAYGYRAALYLIRKYIGQGYTTVRQIISRWAPATENNTTGYINTVCSRTGMSASTTIGVNDREKLVSLVAAMAYVENGAVSGQPVRSEIEDGYKLL